MKITCPQCGFARSVDDRTLPPKAVMATCPKCAHRFRFRERTPQAGPPAAPPEELHSGQPVVDPAPASAKDAGHPAPQPAAAPQEDLWEKLEALNEENGTEEEPEAGAPVLPAWEKAVSGHAQAFGQTVLDVLSDPRRFFSSMLVNRELLKPLLFFLILIEAVALSQAVWQILGILPPGVMMEDLGQNTRAVLMLFVYPLQMAVSLFLDAGLSHLLLRMFRADTRGFAGTFRATAYSSVPLLFLMIPYIGLPMGLIGYMVYKFLGLKYIHRTGTQQVLAVLAMPVLLTLIGAVLMLLVSGSVPQT